MDQTADHPPADYQPGSMDVVQQKTMYRTFNTLLHWACVALATVLSFFVLWLCAHAGFLPSLIVAVIIAGLGSWWLSRPKAH